MSKKIWKIIGIVAGCLIVTVMLFNWGINYYTGGGILKLMRNASHQKIENKRTRLDALKNKQYHKGYIKDATAYWVKNGKMEIYNQRPVIHTFLADPSDSNSIKATVFSEEIVFVDDEKIVNEQVFVIISLQDNLGVKIPNDQFAVLAKKVDMLTPEREARIVAGRNKNVISIDPRKYVNAKDWEKSGDNQAGKPGYNCDGSQIWCPGSGSVSYNFFIPEIPKDSTVTLSFISSSESAPGDSINSGYVNIEVNNSYIKKVATIPDDEIGAKTTINIPTYYLYVGHNTLTFKVNDNSGLCLYTREFIRVVI